MAKTKLLVISTEKARQFEAFETIASGAEIVISGNEAELKRQAETCDVILIWEGVKLFREAFPFCKNLKWVHHKSAGIEPLMFPDFVASPVPLTNASGVYARSLAEFAVTGMLYFAKDLPRMLRNQQAQNWEQYDVSELAGKTLAIYGYGGIGRKTARLAKAFEMRVLALKRNAAKETSDPNVDEMIDLEHAVRMFVQADYLLVSAPLTNETRGAIGERELRCMKKSAVLINLGRGPVIQEQFLLQALGENWIRGAVLDVFDTEPLPKEHPLWSMPNVFLSPHTADRTATWLDETMAFFIGNFKRFQNGDELLNVCRKQLGY